ncbi:aldehyde-activating protein [Chromatiales bacterium (ex Bugula neritina AB1)]|nr:aldehyde-activating protein [Chromatiales bacterium (ex Bugula neritina AB1)]
MKISCHCANISIDAETPENVTDCNCSICSRYHALWGYYPPDIPQISTGSHGTECYTWGDAELEFVRCTKCGCVTHYRTAVGQPDPLIAVNFGMARELVADIPVIYYNGAELL